MRTIALTLTLFGLAIAPVYAGPPATPPATPVKIHRVFDITRNDDKIGTETIDIEQRDDMTVVKTKSDVSVKIMFIEAYRYEYWGEEVYKGGQLFAFKSHTNDNGTKHSVKFAPTGDKPTVEIDGKHSELPKTAGPVSLWRKETVQQLDAFEPDKGTRLSLEATDLGQDSITVHGVKHDAHHYKIADTLKGEYARELWYDGDILVQTKMTGSDGSVVVTELR